VLIVNSHVACRTCLPTPKEAAAKKSPSEGNPLGIGGLTPAKMDTLDIALGMVREAAQAVASKEHVHRVVVDVGAAALWNEDKKKCVDPACRPCVGLCHTLCLANL
jgi:hypothetical protein